MWLNQTDSVLSSFSNDYNNFHFSITVIIMCPTISSKFNHYFDCRLYNTICATFNVTLRNGVKKNYIEKRKWNNKTQHLNKPKEQCIPFVSSNKGEKKEKRYQIRKFQQHVDSLLFFCFFCLLWQDTDLFSLFFYLFWFVYFYCKKLKVKHFGFQIIWSDSDKYNCEWSDLFIYWSHIHHHQLLIPRKKPINLVVYICSNVYLDIVRLHHVETEQTKNYSYKFKYNYTTRQHLERMNLIWFLRWLF